MVADILMPEFVPWLCVLILQEVTALEFDGDGGFLMAVGSSAGKVWYQYHVTRDTGNIVDRWFSFGAQIECSLSWGLGYIYSMLIVWSFVNWMHHDPIPGARVVTKSTKMMLFNWYTVTV